MLRRVEANEGAALGQTAAAIGSEPIVPPVAESDLETALLPQDHPRWVRDAVAVSQRARDLIEKLKPVVVAVMSLWDHRWHAILVGGRRVHIDASGSYRVDR